MPGLQFGSGAYARATAPLTAAPFTWLIAGLYDSLTGSQNTAAILCRASTGGDSFQLRFDSADSGAFRITTQQGGSGSSAITSNVVAASTPFVAIVRVTSSTSREAILNGDLANKATDTASKVPASIDRLSFGRKDDSGATNDFEGSLWYSGLWNVALSDEEILALAAGAPVPRIRPAALQCWWVFDNTSTIVDRLGRAPATVSSGSLTGENGRVYGLRRVYTIKTRARYLPLAAGAFALAGQAVALRAARRLPLSAAAFSLAGAAATLRAGRKLPLATGGFTLTGRSISLRAARKLPLGTGAFILAGQAVALLKEVSTAIGLPVLLGTKQDTASTITSGTITTTAGALLLVLVKSRRLTAIPSGVITITDNTPGGPLAWEACVDDVIQGISPSVRARIFCAIAPGGDLTIAAAASNSARLAMMVIQIDRARIGILNVGHGISDAGDPAGLLAQAPQAGSIVLGFGAFSGAAPIVQSLATEFPVFKPGTVMSMLVSYTRLNPPQAVEWNSNNAQSVGLAIEIEARDYKLEPGAFALFGRDVTLRYNRRLPLETGAFALSGQPVATRKGYSMTLAPASFGMAGHDVAMRRSYALRLGRGAFTLAGREMVLRYGRRLSLDVGSFALTGQAVALQAARRLAVEPVAFSFAAENVALRVDRSMALAHGSFILSGDEVTLRLNRNLPLAAGSFALTGKALGLRSGHKLPLATGAFTLAGQALTPRAARRLPLAAGSFALTGQALGLRRGLRLPLTAGSFVLAGQAVAFSHGYRLALAAAAYGLTGQAMALRAARRLPLAAGSLSLTGRDVALRAARRLALAAVSFALTGQVVRLAADRRLALAAGSFLMSGYSVALRAGRKLPLAAGAYAVTGQEVALRRAARLPLAAGSFALTGRAVALRADRRLPLAAGAFSYAGQDIALRAARKLLLAAGGFSLTGSAVVLRRAAVLPLAAGGFVLTGRSITLARVYTMRLDRGVFVLTGQDIDLVSGELLALRPRYHLRGSYQIEFPLRGEIDVPEIIQLRGEYRLTYELGAASLPGQVTGEVELLSGQDVTIRRNQYAILDFVVAGGAGCTAATWYCAEKASSVPDDVLLEIGGSVSDVGADLIVNVPLLEAQTEALPAGRLFHQLWVTDSLNRSVPAAEGTLTVNDSLRS